MLNGEPYIARVVGGGTVWVLVFVVDRDQNYEEDELGGNTLEMVDNLPIQRVTVQLETPGYSPEIWRNDDVDMMVHMVDNKTELVLRLDKEEVSACLRGAGRVQYEFDTDLIY